MPRVTEVVARSRTLAAQWPWEPSIGQNLQPFSGNGDVSILEKKDTRIIFSGASLCERVALEIFIPRKPLLTEAKQRLAVVFEVWQFPMLYFCAGNIYKKWLNVNLKHRPYYVWFQNNPGQVNICVCISYSAYSNGQMTPVRIYGEQYAHKFCAFDIFFEYHPLSSSVTC